MNTTILLTVMALFGQTDAAAPPKPTAAVPLSRTFRGVMNSPGGELPFLFELAQGVDGIDGWLINGPERAKIPKVFQMKDALIFELEQYGADVYMTGQDWVPLGREKVPLLANGKWSKRISAHKRIEMDVTANVYQGYRFMPIPKPPNANDSYPPVDGRWAVQFADRSEPAVGVFKQSENGKVEGTFLTITGDYRYLAGSYEYGRLRLSEFDGAHAFLFDARMQENGTLKGDYWSRMSWHETWTAKRDDNAKITDGFSFVKWKEGVGFGDVRFAEVNGTMRRLDYRGFLGKARIIEVFGTWCPNCHDAADLLVYLDRKYRDKGLKIQGLAFEVSGSMQRDVRQVERFAAMHNVEYPLLIGKEPDRENVLEALPFLETTHAYPTTIFIRGDGSIRAIHSGFSGPATGADHEALKKRFESIVREMLKLPPEESKTK